MASSTQPAMMNGERQSPVPAEQHHVQSNNTVTDKSLPPTPAPQKQSGAEQKKELMDRMQPPKGARPTDAAQQKGDRWVKDPVTAQDVFLQDPKLKDFRDKGLDNQSLDPANPNHGPALRRPQDPTKQDSRYIAPVSADVGNICLQPFPPPISPIDIRSTKLILRTGAIILSSACALLWFFAVFRNNISWLAWFTRSCLISSIAFVAWVQCENAGRKIEKELERVRMNMHTQRGQDHSPPTPESVEWLNALLKLVWGLVNPEMFIPMVDMVEDVLQASLPSVIDAVRITDVGQGTNPLRIVSMRALADRPGNPEYPREEWVGLDKDPQSKAQASSSDAKDANDPSAEIDTDQTGDYLNYEVSVSYQALPGQAQKLRFHNIHLMLEFFVAAWDWFKLPIPFYAIVEGFVATIRMRIQFVQNPPFVRNVTITLMGIPQVEVSVEPFTKKLPNVLNLPLIKNFVEMGISAACAQYVAPHSLTLNLAQLLVGDATNKDTRSLGVLVITIHHAIGLSAQDGNGKSDPYIILAYAKFGKPLYSTRIIEGDLNPVWEETAFLLVSDDEVKGDEDVCALLWDSDKRTADDLVGRVTIPLGELMREPGKVFSRADKLQGFEDANEMPGTLYWDIGYYDKIPLNTALKDEKSESTTQAQATVADTQAEVDILRTPPDPNVPSGILSVIIHQINNLERQDIRGNTGKREGQSGQDTSEPAEEGANLPNSYCEVILNDDMVYKTRVKQYTSMPYFEAGTERFIRDWKETVVRVQVRDARVREKDPVLGIVTVKLADLFKKSSEITRLFSLQEGIGYGRVNISFLFRQVNPTLPRTLLGWDTGTAEILDSITVTPLPSFSEGFKTRKLTVSTSDQTYKVPSSSANVTEDGQVTWDLPIDKVRLPVYNRYSSAVLFEIGSGGIGSFGPNSDYVAMCWLKDVPDDEETQIRVPVIHAKDLKQIRQNYINDQTAQTHEYDVVGWLSCTLVLDSGLDADHADLQDSRADKHRYEAYDRVEGQAALAERTSQMKEDGEITKDEQKAIDAEKKHQLKMRHRGVMQYQPVRTAKWSKEGIKKRAQTLKNKITGEKPREPTVESETGQ